MKTIHQHIDTDLQTLTGSTTPWPSTEAAEKNTSANQILLPQNQTFVNKFRQVKNWIRQFIVHSLEGQVHYMDALVRNGSPLYPYNFTGSPQAIWLMPDGYRQKKTYSPVSFISSGVSGVKVNRLDEHRYEVQFSHKCDEMILKIYDEAGELLFMEQIYQKGTFNLVYNLQWAGISQVFFEIVHPKKFYQAGIV